MVFKSQNKTNATSQASSGTILSIKLQSTKRNKQLNSDTSSKQETMPNNYYTVSQKSSHL